jgi:septum formation topological specificity factor MinE
MSFLNKIGKLITGSPATSQATASRSVARERLSVILAAQRGSDLLDGVDVEALQRELMEVVQVCQ